MSKLDELYKKYPEIYNEGRPAYGFECGEGWFDLLDELSPVVVSEFAALRSEDPELEPMVIQVKEKFGGLRFYTTQITDRLSEAIQVAEARSLKECESCGSPGKNTSVGGWWTTLCKTCLDKYRAKRKLVEPGDDE